MLLTPELRDRACKIAREEGASRTTIAAALGISSRTLQRWMDYGLDPDAKPEYREFRLLFNQARADHERKLVKKLEKVVDRKLTGVEEALVDYVLIQIQLGLVEVE